MLDVLLLNDAFSACQKCAFGFWNTDVTQIHPLIDPDDKEEFDWELSPPLGEPTRVYPKPYNYFQYGDRAWFYVDEDAGVKYTFLTNIVHTMRIEHNWTNYFEVCYAGLRSPSSRVADNALRDMKRHIGYANNEQWQYVLTSPHVEAGVKDFTRAIQTYIELSFTDPDTFHLSPDLKDFLK